MSFCVGFLQTQKCMHTCKLLFVYLYYFWFLTKTKISLSVVNYFSKNTVKQTLVTALLYEIMIFLFACPHVMWERSTLMKIFAKPFWLFVVSKNWSPLMKTYPKAKHYNCSSPPVFLFPFRTLHRSLIESQQSSLGQSYKNSRLQKINK